MDQLATVKPKSLSPPPSARPSESRAIDHIVGAIALVAIVVGSALFLSRQGWKALAVIIPSTVAGALAYGLVLVTGATIRQRIEERLQTEANALKQSHADLKSAMVEHGCSVDPAHLDIEHQALDPQQFTSYDLTDNGRSRRTNQDAHFDQRLSNGGRIWGVFDGHGDDSATSSDGTDHGLAAAQRAADLFPTFMEEELRSGYSPRIAFERVADRIEQVFDNEFGKLAAGTTALICYAVPNSNLVYTATIGDSEAYLYREIDGQVEGIPLSVVRDWSCEEEQDRLETLSPGAKEDLNAQIMQGDLKPRPRGLPNVSRSFGDCNKRYIHGEEAISHKPTVTAVRVQPGDLLLLGCDGVWDYAKPDGVLDTVRANSHGTPQEIATAIKDQSIQQMEEISVETQYKRYTETMTKMGQTPQTQEEFLEEEGDRIKKGVGDNITVMAIRV